MLAFLGEPLQAQQEGEEKPKPAARVLLPLPDLSGDQQDTDQSDQTTKPDGGPVTGVQNPTLGTTELRHSYWVPGIQYGNMTQSNGLSALSNSGWTTTNYVSGNLSLLEAWSHALLSTSYSGGGFFSNDPGQGNGQFHHLGSAIEIDQRRWQALIIDQFSYLPQSAFGFGGTTDLSFPGITGALAVPLPQLQNLFIPGQSILIATGSRYMNAAAAQLSYKVSARGTITAAVVDGLLRFLNSGSISSDTEILNAGYNYAITRKDYLGATYRFTAFHYPGDPQAVGDHVAQAVYGRRVTKRIGINLGGGPEIITFRFPVGGFTHKISGAGNGSIVLSSFRNKIGLEFLYGVTNGSGVFTGAITALTTATFSRQLSRVWDARVNFGYARNKQIVTFPGQPSPIFDAWVPGAGLNRPLGRNASFSVGYQAQIQTANMTLCNNPSCGTSFTTHVIILSFQWHAPAQVLR